MKYYAPATIEEAIGVLTSEPGTRVFAGATDVVPQMRSGRDLGPGLIDLKKIERLSAVTRQDDMWVIGAAVPAAQLTANADLSHDLPGVVEAAGLIGSDQVQSRSSLGGNVCNASPAADSVPALVAAGARAVIASGDGTRTILVEELPVGPGRTSLAPGEFVVEFEIDRPAGATADAYLRLIPRTEMDIAVVGAGVQLTMDGGTCTSARIALGAVAPTVVRVPDAEAAIVGTTLDDAALAAASAAASAACNPIDDKRGTIAYRQHVAGVLTKRAIGIAADRAQNPGTANGSTH